MSVPPRVGRPRASGAARDVGLRTVSRHKRWLVVAAVGLSGLFSAVAALAKPGATHPARAPAGSPGASVAPPDGGGAGGASSPGAAGDPTAPGASAPSDGGLQAPSQAPTPSPAPPVASSGGS